MEEQSFKASHQFARISPSKMRYVGDLVRDKNCMDAQNILAQTSKRGAKFLSKLLRSAMSNAEYVITEKELDLDPEKLYIDQLEINQGPAYKRWMPRARGRATERKKKTTHATVILKPPNDTS